MSRRVPILAVLGWVLIAAGAVVFWLANQRGGPGWTAYTGSYAPLQPGELGPYQSELTLSFSDRWTVLWTGMHLLGASLVVLGLLVLAGVVGWLVGHRTGTARGV